MEDLYYNAVTDQVFLNAVKRRRHEADAHWQEKRLKSIREENVRQYLADYIRDMLVDERFQEVYNDNRQFTSVRTILPFLTKRLTAPEVTPANEKDLAIQFAEDFEKWLLKHAEKHDGKAKVRLAIQDLLKGQRVGVIKWRYDADLGTIIPEWCAPKDITVGKRGKYLAEPDYVRHDIKKTANELLAQFPDKAEKIKGLFGITNEWTPELEKEYDIKEEWLWLDKKGGGKDLVVGWSWQDFLFGKVADPNWKDGGKNITETHMVPFVFFNFLPDGESYIDETSTIEQAKYLQLNYNKRGQTIAENAKYGGTGVPIFAKGAIQQKDVAKIKFSPIQRVLLDTDNVNNAFTQWQSAPLPQYIVEDKYDERNSIDNIWGTPNVFRGEQSNNNTLGQDVLVRDQAEGRLSDPIDQIDLGMNRFYLLEAQLAYIYLNKKKFVNLIGSSGKFVSIGISSKDISDNWGLQITVKAGTSLPIDRAQKRATVMELAKLNKIGTLRLYKELNIFDDPEEAYKEYLLELSDPATSLSEAEKKLFNREANEDLITVIGGQEPDEREEIENDYLQYLNDWLLTDKYMILQQNDPAAAARVSVFVDGIIAKAQRKLNKEIMQQPAVAPVDPNQAAMEAAASMGAGAPQPGQPALPAAPPTPPIQPVI